MPTVSPGVTAANHMRTGKMRTSGKLTVRFRNVDGNTLNATVLGQSTDAVAGKLKLLVSSGPARRIVDNVPVATARNQTNVYFNQRV
jgi:hypothetical protein